MSKIGFIPLTSLLVFACCESNSLAQNVQNFVNNEENRIQQDSATGVLNPNQTAAIQNRQAQIMNQEVQDKNMNGGNLTPQQQQQIAREERGLAHNVNRNVYQNTSGNTNNGSWLSKAFSNFGQNNNNNNYNNNTNYAQQQYMQQQYMQQQNMQNRWAQYQNGNSINPQNQYYNYNNQGQQFRHQRPWNSQY